MKLTETQQAIRTREDQIAVLQGEISTIKAAELLISGKPAALPPGTPQRSVPTRAKPKPKPASRMGNLNPKPPTPPSSAPSGGVSVPGDKPDTVSGALKYLLRGEPAGASFTRELLTSNLLEDADFKQVYEANKESGEKAIENALRNWTFSGRLKHDKPNYTITADGVEWFK